MLPVELAANAFFPQGISQIEPLGRGLINDTFLVTKSGSPGRAVLQRLNRHVFAEPAKLMENLRVLLAHAARDTGRENALRFPQVISAPDGRDYVIDPQGGFWRALTYLESTANLDVINVSTAAEVGFALGRFHRLTFDLDIRRLHLTRPMFHVTPHYFERYRHAKERAGISRHQELDDCFAFAEKRHAIVPTIENERRAGRLPVRVVHGDPKLDNVLFDKKTHRAVSLIDLDTVQPGILLYDLGDCLRSCANLAGESPTDPDEARFDLAVAEALLRGYFSEMQGCLDEGELRLLPLAIRLIPFELGLRFLTDHLDGDRYFKVERPGQNLWRARTQFRLVESIEQSEREVESLVRARGRA